MIEKEKLEIRYWGQYQFRALIGQVAAAMCKPSTTWEADWCRDFANKFVASNPHYGSIPKESRAHARALSAKRSVAEILGMSSRDPNYKTALRRWKRKHGLCYYCSNKVTPGHGCCAYHEQKRAKDYARRSQKIKETITNEIALQDT